MKFQYNISTRKMSHEELAKTDKLFTEKGWTIIGFNTFVPENFRVYQWEFSDLDPDFPEGFEGQTEPIVLNGVSNRMTD